MTWLPSKVCVLALLHLSELLGRCGFGEYMPRPGDIHPSMWAEEILPRCSGWHMVGAP